MGSVQLPSVLEAQQRILVEVPRLPPTSAQGVRVSGGLLGVVDGAGVSAECYTQLRVLDHVLRIARDLLELCSLSGILVLLEQHILLFIY